MHQWCVFFCKLASHQSRFCFQKQETIVFNQKRAKTKQRFHPFVLQLQHATRHSSVNKWEMCLLLYSSRDTEIWQAFIFALWWMFAEMGFELWPFFSTPSSHLSAKTTEFTHTFLPKIYNYFLFQLKQKWNEPQNCSQSDLTENVNFSRALPFCK